MRSPQLSRSSSPRSRFASWLAASLFCLCVVAVGCGDGGGTVADQPPIIPEITALSAGDPNCPSGGVRVQVGSDEDRDGVLDADEIDQTSYVCNGMDVVGGADDVLVRTVDLPAGAECETGGRRLDIGLDNGDGTGTAGNDVLEDGEVDTSFLDCNEGPMVVNVTPPTGATGTALLDTHGGSASAGEGGAGGDIHENAYRSEGSLDSFLMVANTGSADASCTVPSLTIDLGSVPVDVTTNTTLAVVAPVDEVTLPNGRAFLRAGSDRVFVWNATTMTASEATGLRVAANVTLTLQPNNAGNPNWAGLNFTRDVDIAGAIVKTDTGGTRGHLYIFARQMHMAATSSLSVSGVAVGEGGGSVELYSRQDLVALGSVATNGAAGTSGGAGGSVYISADGALYTGGTITTTGGAATNGSGGQGGSVTLIGETRLLCNAANVTTDGGAADGMAGGGGSIQLGTDCLYGIPVTIRNSGTLRARGGNESGLCPAMCAAGGGGDVRFVAAAGGSVASSGSLDTRGGSSANATGGGGGDISFYEGFAFDPVSAVVRYEVSGTITTFGGDGVTSGGAGGDVTSSNVGAPGSATRFLGYASAILEGGDGSTSGGDGGTIGLVTEARRTAGSVGLLVHTNVTSLGGNGGSGSGGNGGHIDFAPTVYEAGDLSRAPSENFVVEGTVDLRGGNGAAGGNGGRLDTRTGCAPRPQVTGIRVAGTFTLDGGDASGPSSAGNAGFLGLATARGELSLSGSVSAMGGDATLGTGGSFPGALLFGVPVQVPGNLTAGGGTGAINGGSAADIAIISVGGASSVTGTVTLSAGAGPTTATNGSVGTVRVDTGSTCID